MLQEIGNSEAPTKSVTVTQPQPPWQLPLGSYKMIAAEAKLKSKDFYSYMVRMSSFSAVPTPHTPIVVIRESGLTITELELELSCTVYMIFFTFVFINAFCLKNVICQILCL